MTEDSFLAWCRAHADNWRQFDSFAWHAQPADAEQWAHASLDNRDADALTSSNADAIVERARAADPRGEGKRWNVERHSHWECGWVRVLTFRVFKRDGTPTAIARAMYGTALDLEDYPVLDEDDYCAREADEAREAWLWLGRRERIACCARNGASIFAARRDDVPAECYEEMRAP